MEGLAGDEQRRAGSMTTTAAPRAFNASDTFLSAARASVQFTGLDAG
jgi:hypothetical protein